MAGIPLGAAHPTVAGSVNYAPVQGIPLGQTHPTVVANLNPAPKPAAAPSGGGGGGGLIYGGGGGYAAAPAPVYAPRLDVNGLYTQAGNAAAGQVNPYYTLQLNRFIQDQAQSKALQQQQHDMEIKNFQDELAHTQQENAVSGTRATEDTALKEQQIAQAADQTQLDQGSAFDISRNQDAQKEAQSGLAGSGLAAGAEAGAQQAHDLTETRQAEADQQNKAAAELAKARTFEDLGRSNTYAGSQEQKGEQSSNFNLSKFIQGQASDLLNQQQSLEIARKQQLATETQRQAKMLFNNYIAGISNPAQRQAALQTYGGGF